MLQSSSGRLAGILEAGRHLQTRRRRTFTRIARLLDLEQQQARLQ